MNLRQPAGQAGPGAPHPPRQVLADSVYEAVKAMVMDHEHLTRSLERQRERRGPRA
ncbi:hypothetical protein ACFRK5_37295 [Streptomyces niveus]|uniref:hypothetical protein n=1 Tax=Streptomyces niveus TaxID=193462 RepID=UPI0036CFDC34